MNDRTDRNAAPPGSDPDGVRVVAGNASGRRRIALYLALSVIACSAGYAVTPRAKHPAPPPATKQPTTAAVDEPLEEPAPDASNAESAPKKALRPSKSAASARATTAAPATPRAATAPRAKEPEPEGDTSLDLADFIPRGHRPTAGEVIEELHKRGIYDGIAAFPPPGTSPPLVGLSVPEDFELPEGYVRHYQATDDGQPIEAILMFSPDYEFLDENGEVIALPEDLVVPPELAPPGLPLHTIDIPPDRKRRGLSR